jgi:hypothetical protein
MDTFKVFRDQNGVFSDSEANSRNSNRTPIRVEERDSTALKDMFLGMYDLDEPEVLI